jgi:hypothetical protein
MKETIKSILISPEYWAIIIPALSAVFVFYLTKRHQIKSEWQQQKLNHYKVLLSSLSDLAINNSDDEAKRKFALASNTIALVAPQSVIASLMAFHNYLKPSKNDKSIKEHDRLLKIILLEIRKDIGLSKKDDIKTFEFHLVK